MGAAERDSPGGWQFDDIQAQREEVLDEDNAALVVLKVTSLLPGGWSLPVGATGVQERLLESTQEKLFELSPEIQLDESFARALHDRLSQLGAARAAARKLIGMTRGRFPIEWGEDILFLTKLHSGEARGAANLLRLEAALASQEGDADQALADVRGLIGTARSVGDEPLLISVLIRLACDAQAVAALERALAQGQPPSTELKAVQTLLEKEAAEPLLTRALRGERAGLHKVLLALRTRGTSLADLFDLGGPSPTGGVQRKLLVASGPTLAGARIRECCSS
jgi:hypothetical protein